MREIDIIELIKKILKERKALFWSVGTGLVLGVIVALSLPKSYTSSVVLAPEMGSSGAGLSESLSDMASQFGFDLGSKGGVDAIYPEIYPDIFASTDFVQTLLDVKVCCKEDPTERTYRDYLTNCTRIPFWQYPKLWISMLTKKKEDGAAGEANVYVMPKTEADLCDAIKKGISCVVDKKTSVITIAATEQDPLVSAILVDTLQLRLQNYITAYRTKKACDNYDFYVRMHADAEQQYNAAMKEYADYCEHNRATILESYIARRDELENKMQLAFNQMNQLALQIQTEQMNIQERTPAFTIIASAKMPYRASSIPRSVIVIIFLILAIAADAAWIVFIKKDKV